MKDNQTETKESMETVTFGRSELRLLAMKDAGIKEEDIHSEYWDDDNSLTFDLKRQDGNIVRD